MIDYLKNPDEIYRRSIELILAETDFAAVPEDLRDVALRLVHASALPAIVTDLRASPGAAAIGRRALADGAPVLVDSRMVEHGIARATLAGANAVMCALDQPEAEARARRLGITRSAAAVELWRDRFAGAVVAIGTAPTALFRLIELLAEGAPAPAIVLAFPVGMVGAAESKAALVADGHGVPYITLQGRLGGSAIAAAAVNALAGGTP